MLSAQQAKLSCYACGDSAVWLDIKISVYLDAACSACLVESRAAGTLEDIWLYWIACIGSGRVVGNPELMNTIPHVAVFTHSRASFSVRKILIAGSSFSIR
jgi:hypothetical protein